MPKSAGISSSASQDSDTAQFVSIALFSGVGLLISLVVVICSHARHFLIWLSDVRERLPSRMVTAAAVASTQAAFRSLAAFSAPATAFSRCSGPTWMPSAEMNSGFLMPMKPNTQRK